ncbi:CehA/McbA family metallohydrolase [Methanolobus bombayensis]|uniref:CehA/McbA family metallohydrolase n=1 Tax=Methanolobus bombayensis TaxID=38023 RepID=UPI001AE39989|nr:PHP domain-containing protein [Methanolobus bombayensis]MBP1909922.1 putative metal-dependent phosphoesterase TrpH [Methanolobus bombayensis]
MKFDLHVHSCYSKDSNASLDDIIKHAEANGLDGFAICDHDRIEGGFECVKRAQELGSKIIVIPGVEVSSSKGHILALGIRKPIEPGLSPEETIKIARQQGAVVIIPHPFKLTSHGIGYIEGLDADAIEVLNSRCVTDGPNNKARKAAQEHGYPMAGGSDAHEAEMVGRSYTEIDTDATKAEDVLDAIREGKTSPGGEKTPVSFVVKQMFIGHINKLSRRFGMR